MYNYTMYMYIHVCVYVELPEASSSRVTMSSCPVYVSMYVCMYDSMCVCVYVELPEASSRVTMSSCPVYVSMYVCMYDSMCVCVYVELPEASSRVTMSSCPVEEAQCRAEIPSLSCWLTSDPSCSSTSTHSRNPP